MESLWQRVDPDDPRRCQYVIPSAGQCLNISKAPSAFCEAHGSNSVVNPEIRNYRLKKFQAEIAEKASSPNIKSLREEIGILRQIIEERLNRCNDTSDLILQSGPISDLLIKAEKLVVSCDRLESRMGLLLDKEKILQQAQAIVQIVSMHVEDPEVLDRIITDLTKALQ